MRRGSGLPDEQPTATDEYALIKRARNDPEAFGILYERYVGKIYNYIYYRVGNHYDAEDLTARTFYRALNHIARYTPRGAPFSAWLYRIAHNLVVNWHRDRRRHQLISLEEAILHTSPEHVEELHQLSEREDEKQRLLAAVRRLPEDRQQLLILKFVEGLSNVEIGQIMGRSEGAVKSLYYRTLLSLREMLEETSEQGGNPGAMIYAPGDEQGSP
ncbi:MAG: RNA polymerase sigma factor [Anaerolineae bacterium]